MGSTVLIRPVVYVFFFQAEDGIRDYKVTGVQTCALPIFERLAGHAEDEIHADVLELPARLAPGLPRPLGVVLPPKEAKQRVVQRLDAEGDAGHARLPQPLEPQALGVALDRDLLGRAAHRLDHPADRLRAEQ